jgi:alanine dehydrogenase
MRIAVLKTSRLENERRVPVYPEQLPRFPAPLRQRMVFEEGYGIDYGYPDRYFIDLGAAVADRARLLAECEIVVLPKPTPADLEEMHPGQVLFGWAHVVQQKAMTQVAIDRKITIIAWEAMHLWSKAGERLMHVFYKNNEIAGYAAVLHCLQLCGWDGHYGPRRKVVVLSYGSVSRGAIYALQGRGFNNIHVFTKRPPHLVADQNPDVYHGQYFRAPDGLLMVRASDDTERPLIEELADADIICNGILQDTKDPLMFVRHEDVERLKPRSLIVDISCDAGMGFTFAKPTTFTKPMFTVGEHITYYSVDHTPTYLWNAASREISKALRAYLGVVAEGPPTWESNETIRKAIEIQDGVILNPHILAFQRRDVEYPHGMLSSRKKRDGCMSRID